MSVGVALPGYANAVDFYVPAGATQAVVFLHGGAGRNYIIANTLGLSTVADRSPTSNEVNWAWLAAHKILAVFPQGQTLASAPNSFTWNNFAMTSGRDDQAFLVALATHIKSTYGVAKVALAGHSMGGVMVNRMWCDAPSTFNAYISLAGPASAHYAGLGTGCSPAAAAPYMGIIGDADSIMQTAGAWESPTWIISPLVSNSPAFVNPIVIGEWVQHQRRTTLRCGESPAIAQAAVAGAVRTWSNCGGSIVERLVGGADHGINFIEDAAGTPMIDYIASFLAPL